MCAQQIISSCYCVNMDHNLCINAALKTKEDHYGTNYGTVAFKS